MTQKHFAFRIDRWTDDGEGVAEHLAGADDFQVAMATSMLPSAAQSGNDPAAGTWVIETAGVREWQPFFFPWSAKGREGGGR